MTGLKATASDVSRFDVAGVNVDILNREKLLEIVEQSVVTRDKRRVVFCNVSSVVEANHDSRLSHAINTAQVVSPDGMPLVWLAKRRGLTAVERCDGPSFMMAAMKAGASRGWRHYLYGASPAVLDQLVSSLQRSIYGLEIAGAESPPFRRLTDGENREAMARINDAAPDCLWLGLGMPKQELWMAANQEAINAPLILGVGAAFDFHAGVKRRAPRWMQRTGLEWAHRLAQEPGRLWRRYLTGNARFLYLVARDSVGGAWQRSRRPG